LARSKGSLALAKQPKPKDAFWEDLCFQAQQAAEKAIKALYQYKGLSFRYTHDLEELGKGLEDSGVPIPSIIKEAVILTRYAFETRYPSPFEPVTEEEYQEAVRFKNNKPEWENCSIEHYLEGLYGFTSDIDGYYQNMKQDVDTTQASWKMMARILLAARVYE